MSQTVSYFARKYACRVRLGYLDRFAYHILCVRDAGLGLFSVHHSNTLRYHLTRYNIDCRWADGMEYAYDVVRSASRLYGQGNIDCDIHAAYLGLYTLSEACELNITHLTETHPEFMDMLLHGLPPVYYQLKG